jgi:TonB family protein
MALEPLIRDSSKSPSLDELHLLIMSMDDELSGYRWREAIWLSIIAHVVVFLAAWFAPQWLPKEVYLKPVLRKSNLDTTFVVMPRDRLAPQPAPKTDIISDKNRLAQSRTPVPNREALRRLVNTQKAGTPEPAAPPQSSSQQAQQTVTPPAGGEPPPQPVQPQVAQVQPPPVAKGPSPFKTGLSPGSAIDQAVQSLSAGQHGLTHASFGGGGDYGMNRPDAHSDMQGDVDILSDTMGVDFGPYLQRVVLEVKKNWYSLIPESARPPIMKKGKLMLEFSILKNGSVAGLQMMAPSGDLSLDRAAWGGITHSNPFPPLPSEFRGQYLQLRFKFFYNPDKGELE